MHELQELAMIDLKAYFVWTVNIRWFHWINLLCVLGLVAVGVVILNGKVGCPLKAKFC